MGMPAYYPPQHPAPCDASPYCQGYNCCPRQELRCYEDCFFSRGGGGYGGKGGKGGKGGYYGGGFAGYYGGVAGYGGFGGKGGKGGKGGGSSFQYESCVIVCETDSNWDPMYLDDANYCSGYGRNKGTWNLSSCGGRSGGGRSGSRSRLGIRSGGSGGFYYSF